MRHQHRAQARQEREIQGRTPQGRQYYKLGRTAAEKQDWAAVVRNLQTAVTFEPDNARFKAQLAELKAKLK